MPPTQNVDSFLMGSGTPSAKFPTVGSTVTGTIAQEPELQQQVDFDSGEPMAWADGRPRMQARVVLQTTDRDPEIPDDDGARAVYVKANLQKAVAQAVRAAGASRLEVGGTLTVTYSGDGVQQGRKNPPKLYQATYLPPDPVAQAAGPDGNGQQQGPQPGAGQHEDADQPPPGVDPAAWAALAPEQKAALKQAMSPPPF